MQVLFKGAILRYFQKQSGHINVLKIKSLYDEWQKATEYDIIEFEAINEMKIAVLNQHQYF